jgi:hypothetical protein
MNDYNELIERLTVSAGDQECLYSDAKNAIEALQSRVAELESRLEISPLHNVDGIMARDATIKLQDERIAELEAERAERERQKPMAWEGAEQWEPLAMFLCADENGSDSCHEMVWEGYPPEPWGERWQKYESEARRMIDLTRYAFQTVTAPVRLTDEQADTIWREIQDTSITSPECPHRRFKDKIEAASLRANGFDIQPARGEG